MLVLLLVVAALTIVLAAVNAAVLQSWREERRQLGVLADRLSAEARIQALTIQTMQDMRETARTWARGGQSR